MDQIYSPCPCGNGMKFKFCCLKKESEDVLKGAAKLPVYECLIADNEWEEHGLAVLYVCRHALDCRYICAVYMVDTFCLGLKNTFANVNLERASMIDFRGRLKQNSALLPFCYEDARSLILGAIAYATRLGFRPNEDWQYSRYVVEEDRSFESKFEYGRNGRPVYIPGPDDDAKSIRKTLARLDSHDLAVVN